MLKVLTPTESLISAIKKINFYFKQNINYTDGKGRPVKVCQECLQESGHLDNCPVYWIEDSIKKIENPVKKDDSYVAYPYFEEKDKEGVCGC